MGRFVKGDVVVVPFPFSDLSASKRRPALVLVAHNRGDLILCQITSQAFTDEMAITVGVTDYMEGGLKSTSNIRINKLFTADANIILYKAGRLCDNKIIEVIEKITEMIRR